MGKMKELLQEFNDVADRVAGSMALEGLDLTEEDLRRIQELAEHPDQKDRLLQDLVKKHTKE